MSRIAAEAYDAERRPLPDGRQAAHPRAIPLSAWWAIARRTYATMADKNLGLMCAGVAFYGFLSLFPIIVAVVLVYGIVATPQGLESQLDLVRPLLPVAAMEIVDERLRTFVGQPASTLGIGLAVSLALALWSGSRGVNSLVLAIGEAYHEPDRRGVVSSALLSIALTVGAVAFLGFAIAAIAVLPAVLAAFRLGPWVEPLLAWLRWPLLLAAVVAAVTVLYRVAPDRERAKWRWVLPGAGVATALWMVLSVGFTIYVENFASYSAWFGSLAGAVVLMFWMYYSTMAFVLGAALNGQMELQTRRDTTTGPPEPMGEREAVVADHVPETLPREASAER